jgi:hypothetical protein
MDSAKRSPAACAAVATCLLAGAATSRAADVSYGVDVGVGFSDNIGLTTDDEQSETIASVGAEFGIDHESRRLNADVATRLEYREYLDDSYEGEIVGNLVANAVLNIIEERFTWTLEDTFGQTTRNQLAAQTPANRESVNHLSTGPDFMLALGARNQLTLRGRYVDVHYEDSDLGNNRLRGEFILSRDLSDATSLSLNVTSERVEFDDGALLGDFDHNEAFLSYDVDAARTSLSFDAGQAEIRSNGETQDGWIGRLELTRRASEALTLGLELGHDFSDAGNAFAELQQLQPGSVDPVPVQQTAAPFENEYGVVFAQYARNRTSFSVRTGYYQESYETVPLLDRKRLTLDLGVQRHLNAKLTGHASAAYSRQEFEELDREFSDLSASLGLRWSFGRVSHLSVDYRHVDRRDDAGGASYRANELWLRVAYQVGEEVGGSGPAGD